MSGIYNLLDAAIYSKLHGATALTSLLASTTAIYYLQAPDEAVYPFVVFSHYGGGPQNINASDLRNQLVYVRAYAKTPKLSGQIDGEISKLMNESVSVAGYTNMWTKREMDVPPLVENKENGEKIYSSGAVYRIRLTD